MLRPNVKRLGQCAVVAASIAVVAVLGGESRTGLITFRSAPANRMSRLPHVILWAWERREDLSFIDPREAGVAYLACTLYLSGDRVVIRPRRQPLIVPRDSVLIPVVRIETDWHSAPTMSPSQRAEAARAIARLADYSPAAIQIDFDATRSQRAFYRDLLVDLRSRLPDSIPLSITALASWCIYDDWIADLPVDEAVPMLFRMGADSEEVAAYLRRGGDFAPAISRSSVGIAVDEPAVATRRGSPSTWKLASGRTVEHPPVGDVLAQVFETMVRSCGHEEEITSLECFALAFVKQYAPTPDDDVDLVLCVRGLLVGEPRPGEVNVEATARRPGIKARPACACTVGSPEARLPLNP